MTLGEVAHTAAALLGVDNYAIAIRAANLRYQELATGRHMLHLRAVYEVVVPALIADGTITTTVGSNVVTGDSTAQAAWTPSIIGRYLNVKNVFYRIADLQPDKTIILKTIYNETAVTSGGYKIIDREVELDKDVAQIGSMVNMNLKLPIRTQDQDYLNTQAPGRSSVSSGPVIASKIGENINGADKYEFYPYSNTATVIQYTGYRNVAQLSVDDLIPKAIPANVLIEGVQVDLMKAEMTKALKAGQPDVANIWMNEHARQRTIWNKSKEIAFRNDVTTDDATFILQTTFGFKGLVSDNDSVRGASSHSWLNNT